MKLLKGIVFLSASLIVVFLILVAVLKVYGNSRLQKAIISYQKEVGPLDIKSYAPASVQETQNIAEWVTAGAYAFVVEYKDRKLMGDLLSIPYEQWKPEQIARIREVLENNKGAFETLDRSRSLERSSFGLNYKNASDMELPKLVYFLQARKLLGCKWRIDLADGKLEDVMRTAEILERMSSALVHEPVLICTLVGHTLEKEYHDLIHEALPEMDVQSLSRISATLKHLNMMTSPIQKILAAEGALAYQAVAQGKTTDENEEFEEEKSSNKMVKFFDDRLYLAVSLEQHADLSRNSKVPLKEFSLQTVKVNIPIFDEILKDSYNSWQKVIERFQGVQSAQILADASVRLSFEAAKTGAYPKNISQLSVPQSPYTGETVRYLVLEDGSAELSFPEASKFWDQRNKEAVPQKPRFHWKLSSGKKMKG